MPRKPTVRDVARLRLANSRGDGDAVPAQDRDVRRPRTIPIKESYERDIMTPEQHSRVNRSKYNTIRGRYPVQNYQGEKRRQYKGHGPFFGVLQGKGVNRGD